MAVPAFVGPLIKYGVPIVAGALGLRQAGQEQGRARDFEERALDMAEGQWADRAPFRDAALQGLGQMNRRIDSGALFNDAGNPYSAQYDYSRDLGAMDAPTLPQGQPQAPFGPPSAGPTMGRPGDPSDPQGPQINPPSFSMGDEAGLAMNGTAQPAMPMGGNRRSMEMRQFLEMMGRGGR